MQGIGTRAPVRLHCPRIVDKSLPTKVTVLIRDKGLIGFNPPNCWEWINLNPKFSTSFAGVSPASRCSSDVSEEIQRQRNGFQALC